MRPKAGFQDFGPSRSVINEAQHRTAGFGPQQLIAGRVPLPAFPLSQTHPHRPTSVEGQAGPVPAARIPHPSDPRAPALLTAEASSGVVTPLIGA
jgi:hypothetical protein